MIRDLVQNHRWRIGVVAQSHSVVENVLDEIVLGGLDPRLVAKAPASDRGAGYYGASPFTELRADAHLAFADEHRDRGYVIGGTSWDFTNLKRVERDQLDLLVIEEAGPVLTREHASRWASRRSAFCFSATRSSFRR